MNTNFKRLIAGPLLCSLLLIARTGVAAPAADPKSEPLTGTWTMSLIGDHVIPLGLALKQEGIALTGTLTMMGKEIPVKGEVTNGAVTLIGSATMMMRDHAQSTADQGGAAPAPSGMKFTGSVLSDGTLSGELAGPRGPMKWTADRLKERAPVAGASTSSTSSGAIALVGSWNVSVIADHVTPVGLLIEQAEDKVRGVLTLMGGDVPLTGAFANGTLTLSGEFTPDVTAKSGMRGTLKVTATLKADGSIAGEFSMAHGTFPLTGERLKDRSKKTDTGR